MDPFMCVKSFIVRCAGLRAIVPEMGHMLEKSRGFVDGAYKAPLAAGVGMLFASFNEASSLRRMEED